MKTHKYLGRLILPCSYVDNTSKGYRWYIESIHPATKIPYGEQDCARFRSLRTARAFIRDPRNR